MPILSDIARARKAKYFLEGIPKAARILEVGCGSGWVGKYLKEGGWNHYTGMDLRPPADIVGDIKKWRQLGLAAESVDVIIAFEVIEHVDIILESFELLVPGGMLMLTSPLPHLDWVMKVLEAAGLNQKRTSPHSNLVYLRDLPGFGIVHYREVCGLAQWGILQKPLAASSMPRRSET